MVPFLRPITRPITRPFTLAAIRPATLRAASGDAGHQWLDAPAALVLLGLYVAMRGLLDGPAHDPALVAINAATANEALAWLAALGTPLVRDGNLLLHAQGFVTEVHATCTALMPAVLLVAAIALHRRARAGWKWVGMALGVAVVLLVNQCRLVGVIWVGVHAPHLFDVVHGGLAPALLVALATAHFVAWARAVR